MADILDIIKDANPGIAFKNIFTKIGEIIRRTNTNTADIAQNTLGISLLENSLGTIPKMYKALISQAAPIASQTSGTFTVGMIVSTTTYVAGDDFSNWTLVSGTVNTTGAVYQVTEAAPTDWTNSSDLAYDGAPFVVSVDGDGVLNPFLNTLSGTPVWSYGSTGSYFLTLSNEFPENKTFITINTTASGGSNEPVKLFGCGWNDINSIYITSFRFFSPLDTPAQASIDDALYNVSITIEVYP